MEPKRLARVLIPGVCDEYSSFGVSHLARGQCGDCCGALFQTIWCPSPAMASTRPACFRASQAASVLKLAPERGLSASSKVDLLLNIQPDERTLSEQKFRPGLAAV